jgi:hypothetical protein
MPPGDALIDDPEKIYAAIEDAKHLLEKALDPRCIQGKAHRQLLLQLTTWHAFDDNKAPAFLWNLFTGPPPISLRMFGGTATRPMVYDVKAETVVEAARSGDTDVDAALREIAAAFIERGLAVPSVLRTYIVEGLRTSPEEACAQSLRRGRKKSRKIYTNFCRNVAIVTAVAELVDRGFYAGRSDDGAERTCACSIVAEAFRRLGMDISYDVVAKVWTQRARLTKIS